LKLNCTHQLLVYVDDVKIFGGSVRTVKEKAGVFIVASKEIRLEVNGDKLSTWLCLEIRMQDEIIE